MIVGFLAALFFGIFGVAHLINGKIGGAVVYFIGGLIWVAVAGIAITLTAGLAGCILLPIHIYLAYSWSKKGATN
jgi:TM2 domain-containing membrane protein YozV